MGRFHRGRCDDAWTWSDPPPLLPPLPLPPLPPLHCAPAVVPWHCLSLLLCCPGKSNPVPAPRPQRASEGVVWRQELHRSDAFIRHEWKFP